MRSRSIKILAVLLLVGIALVLAWRPRSRPVNTARSAAPSGPRLTLSRTRDGFLLVDAPLLRELVMRLPAKAVLVNVWASWCAPCKEDLPMLVDLGKKSDPKKLAVLLVTVDDDTGLPVAKEMLLQLGATDASFVVKGDLEAFKKEMSPAWPGMIPATFLFDHSGKVRYFWGGPVFDTDVDPILKRFYAGENIDGESSFALAPGARAESMQQSTKGP